MIKKDMVTSTIIVFVIFGFAVFLYLFAYHTINESFFKATIQHTSDLMETIRDQGIFIIDHKLKGLKEELQEVADAHQGEFIDGKAEDIAELLGTLALPEDGIDYRYYNEKESYISANTIHGQEVITGMEAIDEIGSPIVFDPYFDENKTFILPVAVPIKNEGKRVGTLVVRLDGYCISKWIQTIQFQTGMGLGYLIASDGTNIGASREENLDWLETQYNSLEIENPTEEDRSVADLERQPLLGKVGSGSYQWEGETNYLVYAPVHEAKWGFFVGFYGETLRTYIQSIASQSTASSIPIGIGFFLFLVIIMLYTKYHLQKERRYVKNVLQQKEEIQEKTTHLAISEKRFRIALECSNNVVFEYSYQSDEITTYHAALHEQTIPLHTAKEELLKYCVIQDESMDTLKDCLQKMQKGETKQECVLKVVNEQKERAWYKVSMSLIRDDVAVPTRVVGMLEDITQEKSAELDPLTKIYNKKVIEDKITTVLENCDDTQPHFYLIFDIDDFKSVNDTYGHPAGDQVIVEFAGLLKSYFSKDAFVGRIGGDEFCVFFNDAINSQQIKQLLSTFHEEVKKGIAYGYERITITYSCGIASAKGKEKSQKDLYLEADRALYQAKSNGKNQDIYVNKEV